ncbi:hypothetical protein [Leptolyngbya sp. NK1-12]|uniref:hypothetical protein n=1 Tax=Leptolyngbya sp. NK1-12 TaxID=2547451 RepID=UPI00292EFB80|nr:hypothetical protein [Leptolyngbya sp. NK1-12]
MRTFIIIWSGQLVSTVGSSMTGFALTLWAWEVTGSATALALVEFFAQMPSDHPGCRSNCRSPQS